jgi:hypothetical protein
VVALVPIGQTCRTRAAVTPRRSQSSVQVRLLLVELGLGDKQWRLLETAVVWLTAVAMCGLFWFEVARVLMGAA